MPPRAKSGKDRQPDLEAVGLELGNKPPQALDFEQAVLGALLIEPNCVDEVMEELQPSSFYDPRHRMIFEAMLALVHEHVALDLLSVSQKLRETGNFEEVGGAVKLVDLSQKIGAASQVEYYVKILKQKKIQRDLITASLDILKSSYDDSVVVDDLIDNAQSKIYGAIQSNTRSEVQDIGSVINAALDKIEEMQDQTGLSGVPSGYLSIDRITQGWQPSDLIILAARPSVGKTAFSLNIARNAAVDHNMPVAIFSLEMPKIQLAMRLMVTESGLPAEKIKGGSKLEKYEWEQLEVKIKRLTAAPIYVDDTPSLPIMEFRSKAKRLVMTKGVRLIIVDYLQLMQGPAELRGLREQEVAAISRTLKATAKELNIPIIALSQLSRNSVQRTNSNGKPMLSDLRESGSIEQDADMVIFVHRPDFVGLSPDPAEREKTQIIIAKHRNGEIGEIDMLFKSDQVKFVELNDNLVNQSAEYASAMNYDNPAESPFDIGPAGGSGFNPEYE